MSGVAWDDHPVDSLLLRSVPPFPLLTRLRHALSPGHFEALADPSAPTRACAVAVATGHCSRHARTTTCTGTVAVEVGRENFTDESDACSGGSLRFK